ncbi:Nuclear pore complex protein Nup160 [Portunus trituberculatus]|uniref:Nuclear pore complex protein Nup160 n=1 Tax=Portunus trituberculatus TaxID=210409 RepID=A0A5B7CHK9_PORTR|nr:Nuclear pore complex protein Nup160 [Portunus trituberculatus]
MGGQLGLREVLPDQSALLHWRNITIDTGAAQSTLQDIKVPEYGGGYAFSPVCPSTRNRYLFWSVLHCSISCNLHTRNFCCCGDCLVVWHGCGSRRVCHDLVELWEESLDQDFTNNHVQLRFADTPVLEGLSVHETQQHVFILLATVSSVHRFCLPHPQAFQQFWIIETFLSQVCLATLVGYQYGGLEGEVVTILENRARSADILLNNYYHILHAFHVSKHNYKKAASVMYECALRLNVEGVGEKGVRQQGKCYLACLNCLRHIPEQEAWIVRPLVNQPSEESSTVSSKGEGVSPKRSSEGEPLAPPLPRCRPQVKVLELTHIQREYELVHARLLLLKTLPDVPLSGGPLNSADTISLLTHAKLFREAVRLARLFEQPVDPVLKGLAHTCLHPPLVRPPTLEDNSREGGDKDVWWKTLKQLMEQEEKGNQSVLHYAVASTLLQYSTLLPAWLVNSYKARNCGELLRLYVSHGLLEDAVRLAMQYLDGVLGQGTQQVGLSTALHAAAPPVWLPYTALDKLLLELSEVQHNYQYRKVPDKEKILLFPPGTNRFETRFLHSKCPSLAHLFAQHLYETIHLSEGRLASHFAQLCISFGIGSNCLHSHYALIDVGLEVTQVVDVHETQSFPSII